MVQEAAVDDERPVVAGLPDEGRERREREPRLGQPRGGRAVVARDAEPREPRSPTVARSRRVAPPPRESSDASTTSANARRSAGASVGAGQPPASMAR